MKASTKILFILVIFIAFTGCGRSDGELEVRDHSETRRKPSPRPAEKGVRVFHNPYDRPIPDERDDPPERFKTEELSERDEDYVAGEEDLPEEELEVLDEQIRFYEQAVKSLEAYHQPMNYEEKVKAWEKAVTDVSTAIAAIQTARMLQVAYDRRKLDELTQELKDLRKTKPRKLRPEKKPTKKNNSKTPSSKKKTPTQKKPRRP